MDHRNPLRNKVSGTNLNDLMKNEALYNNLGLEEDKEMNNLPPPESSSPPSSATSNKGERKSVLNVLRASKGSSFISSPRASISREEDMTEIKIYAIGDRGVGKSTIILQYVKALHKISLMVQGVNVSWKKKITIQGKKFIVDIHDTNDIEKSPSLTSAVAEAHGYLFVYSVKNKDSFTSISRMWHWLTREREKKGIVGGNTPCVLVGNFADCPAQERQVSIEESKELALTLGCALFETAAVNTEEKNTKASIDELVRNIYVSLSPSKEKQSSASMVQKVTTLRGTEPQISSSDRRSTISETDIIFETPDTETVAGSIKFASIERIIERLTYPKFEFDAHQLGAFLLTYRNYTQPKRVLAELKLRYNEPCPPNKNSSDFQKELVVIQARVINFLKTWMLTFWGDFQNDQNLIKECRAFIQTMNTSTSSLLQLIEKKQNPALVGKSDYQVTTAIPRAIAPKVYPLSDVTQIDPLEFARQETLIEYAIAKKIETSELLGQPWNKEQHKLTKAPNVTISILRFNQVSLFVQFSILSCGQFKQRVAAIQYWIKVAKCLMDLKNFSCLFSVLSGLGGAAIYRLKKSWKAVGKSYEKTLEECRELTSPKSNFLTLRTTLATSKPPLLPYIGVFLQDLTFIEDANPDFQMSSGLINFAKMRLLAKTISDLQQYILHPFLFEIEPTVNEYLQDIPNLIKEVTLDDLYRISLEVETREEINNRPATVNFGKALFSSSTPTSSPKKERLPSKTISSGSGKNLKIPIPPPNSSPLGPSSPKSPKSPNSTSQPNSTDSSPTISPVITPSPKFGTTTPYSTFSDLKSQTNNNNNGSLTHSGPIPLVHSKPRPNESPAMKPANNTVSEYAAIPSFVLKPAPNTVGSSSSTTKSQMDSTPQGSSILKKGWQQSQNYGTSPLKDLANSPNTSPTLKSTTVNSANTTHSNPLAKPTTTSQTGLQRTAIDSNKVNSATTKKEENLFDEDSRYKDRFPQSRESIAEFKERQKSAYYKQEYNNYLVQNLSNELHNEISNQPFSAQRLQLQVKEWNEKLLEPWVLSSLQDSVIVQQVFKFRDNFFQTHALELVVKLLICSPPTTPEPALKLLARTVVGDKPFFTLLWDFFAVLPKFPYFEDALEIVGDLIESIKFQPVPLATLQTHKRLQQQIRSSQIKLKQLEQTEGCHTPQLKQQKIELTGQILEFQVSALTRIRQSKIAKDGTRRCFEATIIHLIRDFEDFLTRPECKFVREQPMAMSMLTKIANALETVKKTDERFLFDTLYHSSADLFDSMEVHLYLLLEQLNGLTDMLTRFTEHKQNVDDIHKNILVMYREIEKSELLLQTFLDNLTFASCQEDIKAVNHLFQILGFIREAQKQIELENMGLYQFLETNHN